MDSASKITKVLDCLKPAFSFCRKAAQWRSQQIAESFLIATSYSTTHLVKVTQSKILGLIDDDSIGIRNINTTFDNGCCQKYIIIIVDKV